MTLSTYFDLMLTDKQFSGLTKKQILKHLDNDLSFLITKPQSHLLNLFKELDSLITETIDEDIFENHPRLKKAYATLQGTSTEVFFEKGLPKLREVRNEIWSLTQGNK